MSYEIGALALSAQTVSTGTFAAKTTPAPGGTLATSNTKGPSTNRIAAPPALRTLNDNYLKLREQRAAASAAVAELVKSHTAARDGEIRDARRIQQMRDSLKTLSSALDIQVRKNAIVVEERKHQLKVAKRQAMARSLAVAKAKVATLDKQISQAKAAVDSALAKVQADALARAQAVAAAAAARAAAAGQPPPAPPAEPVVELPGVPAEVIQAETTAANDTASAEVQAAQLEAQAAAEGLPTETPATGADATPGGSPLPLGLLAAGAVVGGFVLWKMMKR